MGKHVEYGVNDLFTTNPELKEIWDFEKNVFSPDSVSAGSKKKAFFVCSKKHSYEMTISNKTLLKYGCPVCSGKVAIVGENDLFTKFPHLQEQWDYQKNKDINPREVLPYSNKKAWWNCNKNHSYEMKICDRSNGMGCPVCAGKRVIQGINDIFTFHPHLEKEWDFENNEISPYSITSGSNKKVKWKCEEGHSYEMSVCNKIKGCRCPQCSGRVAVI